MGAGFAAVYPARAEKKLPAGIEVRMSAEQLFAKIKKQREELFSEARKWDRMSPEFQGTRDDVKAAKLYRMAADLGHPGAMCNLGVMTEMGRGGLEVDVDEAVRLYRKAAEMNFPLGQCNLGSMYQMGLGVPKDLDEAACLYRAAAQQGHGLAQTSLGMMYEEGEGSLPKSMEDAAEWYFLAAKQGCKIAQYKIGIMFSERHLEIAMNKLDSGAKAIKAMPSAIKNTLEEDTSKDHSSSRRGSASYCCVEDPRSQAQPTVTTCLSENHRSLF